MDSRNQKLAIALAESNKCHNEKYMERLLNSPALQYNKELNYIYLTLPRGEEHLIDKECIDEYYSWLSEYLQDEIERVKIERDAIKIGIIEGNMSANEIDVFKRLLTDPSDEQIQRMIGFNPRKGEGMLITDPKLKLALDKEIQGVKTQAHSELINEIDSIYNERMNKLSDLVVRYDSVLRKLQDKINDVESNKRIFDLQESKKKDSKSKDSKRKGSSKKPRKGKKKSRKKLSKKKTNNNNNSNQN